MIKVNSHTTNNTLLILNSVGLKTQNTALSVVFKLFELFLNEKCYIIMNTFIFYITEPSKLFLFCPELAYLKLNHLILNYISYY